MRSSRSLRRPSIAPMLIAVLVGLLTVVFFAMRAQRSESETRASRAWVRAVLDSIGKTVSPPPPPPGPEGRDSVYWQWVATSAQMQTRAMKQEVRHWMERHGNLLGQEDHAALEAAGFDSPARALRDSLMAHPELIPYRTDSSRPQFVPERIVVLQRPYVFAYFEDGRNRGHMLVEYEVQPEGRLTWKRLWTRKD